jgi:hypothetical protein
MGSNQKFYVKDKNGNFEKCDDQFDVVIHFKSLDDQERFIRILEELNHFRLELPGQQANDTHDIHN